MPIMKPKAVGHHPELAGTVSVTQLARRWKTTRKSIRRLLGHRQLGFIQINGRFRVPQTEVRRYERIRMQRVGDQPPAGGGAT
jgi:hypothetical protein